MENILRKYIGLLCALTLISPIQATNASAADNAERGIRLLVMVDTSKSVGIEGIRSFAPLLRDIVTDDSLAKKTTLIHYPTSAGPRLIEFVNSAEADSLLRIFVPSFGGAELKTVFQRAQDWRINAFDYEIKVIWITDGGGLNRLAQDYSIPSEMEQIAPLENWGLVDISNDNLLGRLQGLVGSYRAVDPRDVTSISKINVKQFLEQTAVPNPVSLNFNFSFYALMLSLLLALSAYMALSPVMRKVFVVRERRIRQDLLAVSSRTEVKTDTSRSSFFWSRLPSFWKLPIENYLDSGYEKKSETKGFPIFLVVNLISGLLFFVFVNNLVLSLLIALIINPYLFKVLLNIRNKKYNEEFDRSLGAILSLASSGLRSGLSLEHSLEAYSKLNENISAKEIRRVLGEVKMGASIEEALKDLATRRKCGDLNWVVEAISIQRQVGGSLSTIIDTVLQTITERAELRREVRTLSAEGRLSAYVLLGLPVGIFLFLFFSRRDYVEVFWREPLGLVVLGLIGTLILVGWFWMQKVVTIKV